MANVALRYCHEKKLQCTSNSCDTSISKKSHYATTAGKFCHWYETILPYDNFPTYLKQHYLKIMLN